MSVDGYVFEFGTKSGVFRREIGVDSQIALLRHAALTHSCGPHGASIRANHCSGMSTNDHLVDVDPTGTAPPPAVAPAGVMDPPPLPLTADAGQSTADMTTCAPLCTNRSLTNRFVGQLPVHVHRWPVRVLSRRRCGSDRLSCATRRH